MISPGLFTAIMVYLLVAVLVMVFFSCFHQYTSVTTVVSNGFGDTRIVGSVRNDTPRRVQVLEAWACLFFIVGAIVICALIAMSK